MTVSGVLRRTAATWQRVRLRHGWLDHLARAAVRYDEADRGRLGRWLLAAVGFAVSIGVNALLTTAVLTGLPQLRMPLRRVVVPALIVVVGLELLKTIGRAFVHANPTHQAVTGTIGLLISLNIINQLTLYAAALTATSTTGDVTGLSGHAGSRSATRDQSNDTAGPTAVPDTNSAGEDTSDHLPPAQE